MKKNDSVLPKHWCMCKEVDIVGKDFDRTCLNCGGKDAYGTSPERPESNQIKRQTTEPQPVPMLPKPTEKELNPTFAERVQTYKEWVSIEPKDRMLGCGNIRLYENLESSKVHIQMDKVNQLKLSAEQACGLRDILIEWFPLDEPKLPEDK